MGSAIDCYQSCPVHWDEDSGKTNEYIPRTMFSGFVQHLSNYAVQRDSLCMRYRKLNAESVLIRFYKDTFKTGDYDDGNNRTQNTKPKDPEHLVTF